jgi:segregation and condensation protein A
MCYTLKKTRRLGVFLESMDKEGMEMEFTYKLEVFEGPLDLLLHLIEKHKIDIYDIPIVLITEQFLAYMEGMGKDDPERASSFIVMAAMLLRIKSKMLLPREESPEGEDADPREELVERLLEYRKYKALSYELKDRQIAAQRALFREKNVPEEVRGYEEAPDLDELLDGLTLERLRAAFEEAMRRSEDRIDRLRGSFGRIEKEAVSLGERMQELEEQLLEHPAVSFTRLLGKETTKLNVVVTFLAVLELMKRGSIRIVQEHVFGEIQIQSVCQTA